MLNRLELWIFRKLLRKLLVQGRHVRGIEKIFTETIIAHNLAFPEDSIPTRNAFFLDILHAKLDNIEK